MIGAIIALGMGVAVAQAPTPEVSGELAQTVATKQSRVEISKFLVAPAQKAAKARDWARAIPLYSALVVARGPASPEAKQLATLWTLAGQNERAAEAWSAYASAITDAKERDAALAEATRLAGFADPFADKLALVALGTEAKQAFTAGRKAFAAKQYGDALVFFTIGYALAPELPGFLRELGSPTTSSAPPVPSASSTVATWCSARSGRTPMWSARSSPRRRTCSAPCSSRRACPAPSSG